ncbi:MAG TPA: hypothetical protein PKA88_25745 [Polyangiaceae bacterium]|nr:hypothetical protein [Polyangiaceae bacterium]HMR79158.1 hypothetical protein [Polyangiaceae bacterium]
MSAPQLMTEKELLGIVDGLIRDAAYNRPAAVAIGMAVGAAVEAEVRERLHAESATLIPTARLIELETAEHERDILQTNTQSLAMMLRKCAHRLKCNGHEDLSADVVGLLRRYGLLGSPLRDEVGGEHG